MEWWNIGMLIIKEKFLFMNFVAKEVLPIHPVKFPGGNPI